MERINSPLLAYVEAFGTRSQEQLLSETIVGTWDVRSDVLGNARMVGADATGPALAAGATGQVATRVEADTYVTAIWVVEPETTVIDTVLPIDAFILRNQGGTFTQMIALQLILHGAMTQFGNGAGGRRAWPLKGLPWGSLLRGGDLITMTMVNRGAAALPAGAVLAYRGLAGPPA